jgi:hypothetical protein
MARKPKNIDANIDEVINQEVSVVNSDVVENEFEVDTIISAQGNIKKAFNIKLSPYVKQPISCENSKVKITNLGFGDVVELNSKKVLFTGDAEIFDCDVIVESASFPVVQIEIF